jgi:hypothetical protein
MVFVGADERRSVTCQFATLDVMIYLSPYREALRSKSVRVILLDEELDAGMADQIADINLANPKCFTAHTHIKRLSSSSSLAILTASVRKQ